LQSGNSIKLNTYSMYTSNKFKVMNYNQRL